MYCFFVFDYSYKIVVFYFVKWLKCVEIDVCKGKYFI